MACVLCLAGSGCATVNSVSREPLTDGLTWPYPVPLEYVIQATRTVMTRGEVTIERDAPLDTRTWMIVGTQGVSLFSWGEIVRVVIVGYPWTTVTAYCEPRIATNVTAMDTDDFAAKLFPAIALELAQMRAPDLRYMPSPSSHRAGQR
jgi:hypothetical protein